MPLFLIYDSDPALSALLQEQLAGWELRHVSQAGDVAGQGANAVLLAGEGDHSTIAGSLRASGMIGPIFSLVEEAAPPLIALARPLRLPALMARLEAPNGSAVDGAVIGPWRLDLAQRALVDGEKIERLTDKEFALIELLLLSHGETVDSRRLQSEIWRYHAEADSHTVETHVWRLRQKLEVDPSIPTLLLTASDGYYINV